MAVTALYDGHSAFAITGVMAACALAALSVYVFGVRRATHAAARRA